MVLDNFCNSSAECLRRVVELAGDDASNRLVLIEGDIRSPTDLDRAFTAFSEIGAIDAVVHCAGLKAVGDSLRKPLHYWDVNVTGTIQLITAMRSYGCFYLVFSSSATVYGIPDFVPISEESKINPINPYGSTKATVEQLLGDLYRSSTHSGENWSIACLRYFNPVGAHPSGRIGEDPLGEPSNLFPLVAQVASGQKEFLQIYGDDWPTSDGTGERDFIHVLDLAEGHQAALNYIHKSKPQLLTLNLGSGQGHTVNQVLQAYSQVSSRPIPVRVVHRRPGDTARSVADPSAANSLLGWHCKRTLNEMCADSWNWHYQNPNGYRIPCQ